MKIEELENKLKITKNTCIHCQTLELAKQIRYEKEQQMKDAATGYRLPTFKKVNIFDCMDAYYENYTKGDKRMIKAAIKRFKDFTVAADKRERIAPLRQRAAGKQQR